ncbi:MAG: hypothetical protein FWF15_02150 [Oscillospiraceae bacterium]|nr:hypothetical protein [Oscillospiraceae bacterium]
MKKKIIGFILLVFVLFSACSQNPGSQSDNETQKEAESTAAEDKFAKYNFDGQLFRVHTSINSSDVIITNSNYMIEGTGQFDGDIVNDAVYMRNMDVENLLNVKFAYTQIDEDYGTIENILSKLIMSGSDEYDLIINDLRSLVNLSLENMFLNYKKTDVFDLSQNYWYNAVMEDIAIGKEKSFILAGDYFIDMLRNCHALFLNKSMLEDQIKGGSDELYQKILDGKWTFEEFAALTKAFLKDLDGDGVIKNADDQFGFICVGTWGSAIPFMMAADTDIFTKDADGIPELTINNPKSLLLHESLAKLFVSSFDSGANSTFLAGDLVKNFQSRKSLMVGYQRLSTLEQLRSMEDEISILPYPKLTPEQPNYITAAHDTIEVGAIPTTTPNFDMICVVLEVLNRETMKTVIPPYYEQSLKIKYTRDDTSAQIIDIIHDSLGNVFALAYSQIVNGILDVYNVTSTPNFASKYAQLESATIEKLEKVIDMYMEAGS